MVLRREFFGLFWEDVPELLCVGFTDQLQLVTKQHLLGVANLKRNLVGVLRVAKAIGTEAVAQTVVWPFVIAEFILCILQKVMPFPSSVDNRQL